MKQARLGPWKQIQRSRVRRPCNQSDVGQLGEPEININRRLCGVV